MIIRTVSVTPFAQNCSVVLNDKTGEVTVIDPGGEVEKIILAASASSSSESKRSTARVVGTVLLTHSHLDHAGGVARLLETIAKSTGAAPKLFGHRLDRELRQTISQQSLFFGFSPGEFESCPEPDLYLEDGDEVQINGATAKVLFVPGHAPGHVAFFLGKQDFTYEIIEGGSIVKSRSYSCPVLFGGDTLFQGSVGRTDLPGGDTQQLFRSIREKIFNLPDETLVLPGHGPTTTVGQEKRSNPFFQ